ncbi:hypothetical protein [Pseudomonas indica]|uniref:hypothetical protein n=1 Tax=Pseudomonas indica TaxID=137658 RepID=UPI003FD31445
MSISKAGIPSRVRMLLQPLSLATAGIATGAWLLWDDAFSPLSLELAASAVSIGLVSAIWSAARADATLRSYRHGEPAGKPAQMEIAANLDGVLPACSRQLEIARHYSERTTSTLATCFTDLATRTERLVLLYEGTDGGLPSLFELNRCALGRLKRSLETAGKESLAQETRELLTLLVRLQDQTKSLSDTTRQNKLLILDASISLAASQSEKGKLTSVAAELRQRQEIISDQEGRIRETVAAIHQGIASTQAIAQQYLQFSRSPDKVQDRIFEELDMAALKVLDASMELRQANDAIANEVALLLLALQFQERTADALERIDNSFASLMPRSKADDAAQTIDAPVSESGPAQSATVTPMERESPEYSGLRSCAG